jgi:hypothetical protein
MYAAKKALVHKVEHPWMTLELPSGGKINSVRHPDLNAGDVCYFTWDYTRSKVNTVMTREEYLSSLFDHEEEPDEILLGFDDELGPEYWPSDDVGSGGFSDPSYERVWEVR